MSVFSKKPQKTISDMQFSSRAEAFNSMLAYLIEDKNMEPMEAARQANEFAEIFATNMGIPLKKEPELKGVDKYISYAEKIGDYAEKHPKVVEIGLGVLTFVAGLVTGKKVEEIKTDNAQDAQTKQEPIDFDKID